MRRCQNAAVRQRAEQLRQRLGVAGRVESDLAEDAAERLGLLEQAEVGGGVLFREAGEFGGGALGIVPQRDRAAVEERHVEDGVGRDVLEAVGAQIDFVIAQHGIVLKADVDGGAQVLLKAGERQGSGQGAAADHRAAFEDDALVAGGDQIGRRGEAVVAGAGDDDVEFVSARRLRSRRTAERSESDGRGERAFHEITPADRGHGSSIEICESGKLSHPARARAGKLAAGCGQTGAVRASRKMPARHRRNCGAACARAFAGFRSLSTCSRARSGKFCRLSARCSSCGTSGRPTLR